MTIADHRADEWIAAWNSHDLNRILALYAEDAEMASPKIAAYGMSSNGTLKGKTKLRKYWSEALAKQPLLRFRLNRVFASPDSLALLYTDQRGHVVCEYLQYNAKGGIIRAAAHHAPEPR